jgi:3-phenylpropionate/trans-cinnamate dioxygenase ferredoxin reductase component
VHFDSGVSLATDLVLAATGITPQSALAERAGLAVQDGRIVVDAAMRTSVDGVYAAGDVARAFNTTAGRPVAVEHWQDADDQGAIAGANAAGGPAQEWDSVPGFWSDIGAATLKYHAWGDGFSRAHFRERGAGWTVWYESDGAVVGVLTCDSDDDYDRGEGLISSAGALPDDV